MAFVYPNYTPFEVSFVKGEGDFLYDDQGKRYIDLLAGIAVTSVGHCHPEVVSALIKQVQTLWHVSNLYQCLWQEELAEQLIRLSKLEPTKLNRVFFCNSGTEANEAALKLCRIYGQRISKKKFKVISLFGSFHGRSLGSACLTGQKKGQELMGPLPEGFHYIEPNDLESLEAAFDEDVCGFFVESVLGEGGVLPLKAEFLQRAQELCKKHSALLVCDEVQAGVFRTGPFWAHQRKGVEPDLVTAAKGLGGGFPVGALLTSEALSEVLTPGTHGSTFGGNALAVAAARAVLDVLEKNNVSAHVKEMESCMAENFNSIKEKFPNVVESVRGEGLLWGLVLKEDLVAKDFVKRGLDHGVVFGGAGKNVLRFAPNLLIKKSNLEDAFHLLERVLA
ncbi:acetylornithine/succinylornithine family transaminase [bacterium]|nr:acetylornithine/succinylornithine family transaminase [bacterium]